MRAIMACIRDERKAAREPRAPKAPARSRSNMPQARLTRSGVGLQMQPMTSQPTRNTGL